jgi:hypothetical protein
VTSALEEDLPRWLLVLQPREPVRRNRQARWDAVIQQRLAVVAERLRVSSPHNATTASRLWRMYPFFWKSGCNVFQISRHGFAYVLPISGSNGLPYSHLFCGNQLTY